MQPWNKLALVRLDLKLLRSEVSWLSILEMSEEAFAHRLLVSVIRLLVVSSADEVFVNQPLMSAS